MAGSVDVEDQRRPVEPPVSHQSALIVSVGVVGLESADQISNSILQIITDRIG
jgi:hypothetical protein